MKHLFNDTKGCCWWWWWWFVWFCFSATTFSRNYISKPLKLKNRSHSQPDIAQFGPLLQTLPCRHVLPRRCHSYSSLQSLASHTFPYECLLQAPNLHFLLPTIPFSVDEAITLNISPNLQYYPLNSPKALLPHKSMG